MSLLFISRLTGNNLTIFLLGLDQIIARNKHVILIWAGQVARDGRFTKTSEGEHPQARWT